MGIYSSIRNTLDQLFCPERCLICKKQGNVLCDQCIHTVARPQNTLPKHTYALYEYRTPAIKRILTNAKYRKQFAGLTIFGPYLASAVFDILSEYNELIQYTNYLIIPVPISKKRLKTRGFNQTEILARSMITDLKETDFKICTTSIKKIKDSTPQASIKQKSKRLDNTKGTFKVVDASLLPGSFCIILDDVTTTGGTIAEMRQLLLAAGAHTVIGLAVAH